MMSERGIRMANTTILRWVQHDTPESEKRWQRVQSDAASDLESRVGRLILIGINPATAAEIVVAPHLYQSLPASRNPCITIERMWYRS